MKLFPNTIFNFHSINNYSWLDKTFCLLKKNYNIVSLDIIKSFYYENLKVKNACHITFDDGDNSFFDIVYPLIQKHHLPVSLFVSPSAIIDRKNFWFQEINDYDKVKFRKVIAKSLNREDIIHFDFPIKAILKCLTIDMIWNIIYNYQKETNTPPKPPMNINISQLRELNSSGLVSIGAHTLNHPILSNESDKNAEFEIKSSIDGLQNILNKKIEYFSYPNGNLFIDFGSREINFLKESGIKVALSTEVKTFNLGDNPLAIPRNEINHGNKIYILIKMLTGKNWLKLQRIFKGKLEPDHRKLIRKVLTE